MKRQIIFHAMCMATILQIALSSCVNNIFGDSDDDSSTASTLPILITSYELHSQIYDIARTTSENLGLYVMLPSAKLNGSRYLSNERYTVVPSGFHDVDGNAFYPAAGCNLFSYYPYSADGVHEKSYEIDVKVESDQSTLADYNHSDFMTAETSNVSPADKAVEMDYKHKFMQLNFVINIIDDTDVNTILELNPEIIIGELYTTALYNVDTDEFSCYGGMSPIIPYGSWIVSGNSLLGKRAIVLPQTVEAGRTLLRLKINGISYLLNFSEDYRFVGGKEINIAINFSTTKSGYGLQYSIGNWNEAGTLSLNMERATEYTSLNIADIDFDSAPVMNVLINFTKVALICRELLYSSDTKCQAIVVYPYRNGAADLTDGTVLELIGNDDNLHGGKISWNTIDGTYTYTGGTKSAIGTIWFSKDGEFHTSAIDDAASVTVSGERVPDSRTDVTTYYTIAKIGTQYWLRENLSAILYNDGKSITKRASNTSSTAAGYYLNGSNIYYNQNAAISDRLAPSGCRVANYSDWSVLKSYIRNDASLLKPTDSWSDTDSDLSGFCAIPCGAFFESESGAATFQQSDSASIFWVMAYQSTSLWRSAIMVSLNSNQLQDASYTSLSGLSIRCLKE